MRCYSSSWTKLNIFFEKNNIFQNISEKLFLGGVPIFEGMGCRTTKAVKSNFILYSIRGKEFGDFGCTAQINLQHSVHLVRDFWSCFPCHRQHARLPIFDAIAWGHCFSVSPSETESSSLRDFWKPGPALASQWCKYSSRSKKVNDLINFFHV